MYIISFIAILTVAVSIKYILYLKKIKEKKELQKQFIEELKEKAKEKEMLKVLRKDRNQRFIQSNKATDETKGND